jgi:hypothetical protein
MNIKQFFRIVRNLIRPGFARSAFLTWRNRKKINSQFDRDRNKAERQLELYRKHFVNKVWPGNFSELPKPFGFWSVPYVDEKTNYFKSVSGGILREFPVDESKLKDMRNVTHAEYFPETAPSGWVTPEKK